jgi:hypothetical protein
MITHAEPDRATEPAAASRGSWRRGGLEAPAPHPVSARVQRLRRACLRAVARAHGQPEPTVEACDEARWTNGLAGAYQSIAKPGSQVPPLHGANAAARYEPPYGWAVAVAGAALFIGLALAPVTAFWETSGHLPPAQLLGIPNAPASLPFALAARGWTWVSSPLPVSTDVRLTLFALLAVAALATLTFLVVHRLLSRLTAAQELAVPFAVGVSLLGAGLFAALGSDVAEDGAWVLHATLLVGVGWMVWRWRDRRSRSGSMPQASVVSLETARSARRGAGA